MKKPYPYHAHIEPTTLCNFKCESCTNEMIPASRRGHLTLRDLRKLVEKNVFLKDISLIGLGEPLLNPEIGTMLAYLKDRGIPTRTATNGMILDQVDLGKILANVDELIISFDSDERESFEVMRKGANFDRIVSNVQKAAHLKKTRRIPVTLSLQTVISRTNLPRLSFLPPLAKKMGMDKIRFSSAVQYNPNYRCGNENDAYGKIRRRIRSIQGDPREQDLAPGLKNSLQSICDALGLQFSFSGFSPRYQKCWWPAKGIFITYDGFVTPCCMRMDPTVLNFGNLFQQTFDEIRDGDAFEDFMRSFRQGLCPEICKECPA